MKKCSSVFLVPWEKIILQTLYRTLTRFIEGGKKVQKYFGKFRKRSSFKVS